MPRMMEFPEPCIVHMTSYDPDCAACAVEIATVRSRTNSLEQEIVSVATQIELAGGEIDPLVYVSVRLDTLVDSLLQSNPKQRTKFDLTVAMNIVHTLRREQAEHNGIKVV